MHGRPVGIPVGNVPTPVNAAKCSYDGWVVDPRPACPKLAWDKPYLDTKSAFDIVGIEETEGYVPVLVSSLFNELYKSSLCTVISFCTKLFEIESLYDYNLSLCFLICFIFKINCLFLLIFSRCRIFCF